MEVAGGASDGTMQSLTKVESAMNPIFLYNERFLDARRRSGFNINLATWTMTGYISIHYLLVYFFSPGGLGMLDIKAVCSPSRICEAVTRWRPNTRIESEAGGFSPVSPSKTRFTDCFRESQPLALKTTAIQEPGVSLLSVTSF